MLILGFGLHRNTQLAQKLNFGAYAKLVEESWGDPHMGHKLQSIMCLFTVFIYILFLVFNIFIIGKMMFLGL